MRLKVAEVISQYVSDFSNGLNDTFLWYENFLFSKVVTRIEEFTERNFSLKFISVSEQNNIFFTGEEYFVTKIRIDRKRDVFVRISSVLMDMILTSLLGDCPHEFSAGAMTELEAKILTGLNDYIYKGLSDFFVMRVLDEFQNPNTAHFTFASRNERGQVGKMVLSIPISVLPDAAFSEKYEAFDMNSFAGYKIPVNVITGISVMPLYEVKHIEAGDIVVLEQSNIKSMTIDFMGKRKDFAISPDTSIILGIDNNGGNEDMAQNINGDSGMWDVIPVDIVAEFENVTISLGELKQITEGNVVDLASLYENKIYLKVENKRIASGELVIINDKYAVRIEEVYGDKPKPAPNVQPQVPQQPIPQQENQVPENFTEQQAAQPSSENEDFDYNDFEIEDEDI